MNAFRYLLFALRQSMAGGTDESNMLVRRLIKYDSQFLTSPAM